MSGGADAYPREQNGNPRLNFPPGHARQLRAIQWGIGVLLGVLVLALAYWQFGRTKEIRALDQRQSLRHLPLPASRGLIYDRHHRLLAGNRANVSVVVELGKLRREFSARLHDLRTREARPPDPALARQWRASLAARARLTVAQQQLDRINRLMQRDIVPVDAARLESAFAHERRSPFVLVDHLQPDEVARVTPTLDPDGALHLQSTEERWYPHGRAFAHVLGRLASGAERQFDAQLRGTPGDMIIRVDAFGFPAGAPLARHEPVPGQEVLLSVDLDLQLVAERMLASTPGNARGAAVAIAVKTGEILALVSKPDFDLNAISPVLTEAMKQRIDAEGGWFNRATQGLYPPGSTFKIFTALAGLRGGTLRPDDVLHCDGFLEVNGRRFLCHNSTGHGDLTLRGALAHSCNVFAYRTGLAAGPAALTAEARRFHFHEPTGIELPETQLMAVPDAAAIPAGGRGSWSDADTANFAIGQGALRYSPLQSACAIASLARGEMLTVPTLRAAPKRRPTGNRAPEPLDLPEADYKALIAGLHDVIRVGIGQEAQVPGIEMAGKSGTAQVMRKEGRMNIAWFVAFAPVDQPEIAVAVALEGGEPGVEFAGAEHAAPVVREIIATYFEQRGRR